MDVLRRPLGGAEDHGRAVRRRDCAQGGDEIDPVHFGHLPVGQHEIGHRLLAARQRLFAVLRFDRTEAQAQRDLARHLAHHAAVIDHQAGFRLRLARLVDVAHRFGRTHDGIGIDGFAIHCLAIERAGVDDIGVLCGGSGILRLLLRLWIDRGLGIRQLLRQRLARLRAGRAFDQMLNGASSRLIS